MSKELKIGIVSIIALALAIWGYQFMKGRNLLGKVQTFTTTYANVEGLKMAAPVEINGFVVGSVSGIKLDPRNAKGMIVSFDVLGEWKVPNNAKALLAADNSLVGSKKIILDYDTPCSGGDCAKTGTHLKPGARGVIEAVLGKDGLKNYISDLRYEAGPVVDTILQHLSGDNTDNTLSNSLKNLEKTMENMASLTNSLDGVMKRSYSNLNKTVENISVITTSLANANTDIEKMVANLSSLSEELASANIGATMNEANTAVKSSNELIKELQTTAKNANTSVATLNEVLAKVNEGGGTVAKVLNDPEIYNNLTATTQHLALLLQDMRLNPKRYVRLSVFGRKGNQYTYPEEDPAFESAQKEKKEDQ